MSKMKYIFYSISSLFLVVMLPLFIVGCKDKDDDPPVPKPVEEKNYWSNAPCKIDGKPWGDCFPSFMNESRTSGNWYKDAIGKPLRLYFTNVCDSPFTNINIYLNDFTGIGSYTVSTNSYAEYEIVDFLTRIQYRTDMTNKGTITITKFDTSRCQASGTYEFKAFNPDSNRIKAVTNGVFSKITFSVI